jgi:hypothetical protein
MWWRSELSAAGRGGIPPETVHANGDAAKKRRATQQLETSVGGRAVPLQPRHDAFSDHRPFKPDKQRIFGEVEALLLSEAAQQSTAR